MPNNFLGERLRRSLCLSCSPHLHLSEDVSGGCLSGGAQDSSTMPTFFFALLFVLSASLAPATAADNRRPTRRILHQPFFPLDTFPPTQAPASAPQAQPRQQPKFPFSSSSSNKQPFFPAYASPPPPPSPTALATFPANISSLLFPHSSSRKEVSPKLVAIAAGVSIVAVALVAMAAVLLHHRRQPSGKDPRSDSLRLFPANAAVSDGIHHHKQPRSSASGTSSEFLYLGTLVNSRGADDEAAANSSNAGTKRSGSASPPYQKLSSPELHPLPPLPRQNFWHSFRNSDEEDEEFFSPRGSSSPAGAGSTSRPAFTVTEAENYLSRRFDSRTTPSYPSSNSASPMSSRSNSPSPPLNSSPEVSKTKSLIPDRAVSPLHSSPETLKPKPPTATVNFTAPPPLRAPPPLPRRSGTPSPPSEREELEDLGRKISEVSGGSPQKHEAVSIEISRAKPPPPPPPPPPPRFWEIPADLTPIHDPIFGPPALAPPSRAVVFQSPAPESEQPEGCEVLERNVETRKPKLKPLHWDKVRASSDRAMVWDQLKSSSFQLNEEMIETLFMVNTSNLTPKDNIRRQILPTPTQENQVLDPKKSQNIAILLRALNVTIDEVCEALLEGNTDTLGTELLESLLKMAPTKEEERKLKEFKDESPFKLGPAERFLRAVLNIPFAFKRVDTMLYIANFDSEVEYLKRSFDTLETACEELRNSRMFLKLLEAVLKTGNRMNVGTNRGDAHAFKLDTLLKLVDIKGADGKTTLLHFVVQEIIRAEGSRLSGANQKTMNETTLQSTFQDDVEYRKLGLQVVAGLSGELTNVKKAAAMDSDVLSNEVTKLAQGMTKIREVTKLNEEIVLKESSGKFAGSMKGFVTKAEEEIIKIQAQESATLTLVKEITEYFHGNSAKEEAHPFRIFMVVRDFLSILDQVCKEVGKINERIIVSSARQFPLPPNPSTPPIFPGFNQRPQYDSSGDESSASS